MNAQNKACAFSDTGKAWESLEWDKLYKHVRGLQVRIVKAWKEGRYNKARVLQRILTKSFAAKALAVKRVTTNKGKNTPGVDKVVWRTSKDKMGAIREIRRRGYKAEPLRRIYIPKKNKAEKRPLGIPTMKDRTIQALYLMALEPIAETTGDKYSYGFRQERSTHDAIEQCFKFLSRRVSPKWILEGDIKGCFENISHQWLMNNITMDKQILCEWLTSGYIYNKCLFPTERGSPQGGISSPTLANMVLDGLDKLISDKFPRTTSKERSAGYKVNLVRYADDFIITAEKREVLENIVKPMIEEFLAIRGLELSKTKTRITHIEEGFDFLGQNIRKYNGKLLIKPSKQSVKSISSKISNIIKTNKTSKQENLIHLLNPVIRGWCEYHKHSVASDIFYKLDHIIWEKIWKWCLRRHPRKGRKWIKHKYFKSIDGRNWTFAVDDKDKNGKTKKDRHVNVCRRYQSSKTSKDKK